MISKVKKAKFYFEILKNMGLAYVFFRLGYIFRQKTGILKRQFPTQPPLQNFINLDTWRAQAPAFFFKNKAALTVPKRRDPSINQRYSAFEEGKLSFFNAQEIQIGRDYDWLTNPSNGFRYDINKHWTEINDFSAVAGDIKYVWEKSRFSYLFDIIRHDYHFEADHSALVFSEIENWIQTNPINQGPNYKCSQEMSLRVLNWTFALYYYRDAPELTAPLFEKIMHTIYWHLKHIRANIHFSRKTVRNNHAITEVLMLYFSGLLFPFFPESAAWKKQGKAWFEQEIAFQVYNDGTFLQYSHNYHRVLVQLLTWAFYLAEAHGEEFSEKVYARAHKTVDYLYQNIDPSNGYLPNYGHNDGALFFKLSSTEYRDYRPQVAALYFFLYRKTLFTSEIGTQASERIHEDSAWYFGALNVEKTTEITQNTPHESAQHAQNSFPDGGIFTYRDADSFSFIKCASYINRPAQADNLHLDIWYKGQNVLRDAGTYKYNADAQTVQYFAGTASHNTLMLPDTDQMEKGPRFIWLKWSERLNYAWTETPDFICFEGKISAFRHVSPHITHTRKIKKSKNQPIWEIEDFLEGTTSEAYVSWHFPTDFFSGVHARKLQVFDENGDILPFESLTGAYSSFYGVKEPSGTRRYKIRKQYSKTIIDLR
jgi:hypothetical protein